MTACFRQAGAPATQWVRSIEYEIEQGLFVSRNEVETTTVGELLNRYPILTSTSSVAGIGQQYRFVPANISNIRCEPQYFGG